MTDTMSSRSNTRGTYDIAPDSMNEYDIVVECIGTGHAHKKYHAVKNGPGLSTEDLAVICDGGNLCFGYRTEGPNLICVYTD